MKLAATLPEPVHGAVIAGRGMMRPRLGDILVELGICGRSTIEAAVIKAEGSGRRIGQVLLEDNLITSDQLARAIAKRFDLDYLELADIAPDIAAAQLVPAIAARRMRAVPVEFVDAHTLLVAMTDPSDIYSLDDMSMLTGMSVKPAVVSPPDLDLLLDRLSPPDDDLDDVVIEEDPAEAESDDTVSGDDAPTVKLVRSIIAQAVDAGASDIHFEPEEGGLRIRIRIDGIMTDASRVPRRQAAPVISRIKILGSMDISERRLPQDGRIGLVLDDRRVDIRVSIMPLVAGEKAVLRVLDRDRSPLSLDDLRMSADNRERVERCLGRAQGGILATGPTGSGKTTTLYAALATVRSPEKTLITIEDPVEYRVDGVSQVQVFERAGLTFATALRSVVRSDPDVIMVGEMRDRESAHIAIESALTGHLVLSTLHTNDAPTTPWRLIDMGIEPYLVASALDCVIAQRLVRRLCTACRKPVRVPGKHVGLTSGTLEIYEADGCPRCRHTGYKSRLGIYEVMVVSEEIRALIVNRRSADEIRHMAVKQGMRLLRDDGLDKVRAGETSLAELSRVVN